MFEFLKNPYIIGENNFQILANLLKTMKTHSEFYISLINEETFMPDEKSEALRKCLLVALATVMAPTKIRFDRHSANNFIDQTINSHRTFLYNNGLRNFVFF